MLATSSSASLPGGPAPPPSPGPRMVRQPSQRVTFRLPEDEEEEERSSPQQQQQHPVLYWPQGNGAHHGPVTSPGAPGVGRPSPRAEAPQPVQQQYHKGRFNVVETISVSHAQAQAQSALRSSPPPPRPCTGPLPLSRADSSGDLTPTLSSPAVLNSTSFVGGQPQYAGEGVVSSPTPAAPVCVAMAGQYSLPTSMEASLPLPPAPRPVPVPVVPATTVTKKVGRFTVHEGSPGTSGPRSNVSSLSRTSSMHALTHHEQAPAPAAGPLVPPNSPPPLLTSFAPLPVSPLPAAQDGRAAAGLTVLLNEQHHRHPATASPSTLSPATAGARSSLAASMLSGEAGGPDGRPPVPRPGSCRGSRSAGGQVSEPSPRPVADPNPRPGSGQDAVVPGPPPPLQRVSSRGRFKVYEQVSADAPPLELGPGRSVAPPAVVAADGHASLPSRPAEGQHGWTNGHLGRADTLRHGAAASAAQPPVSSPKDWAALCGGPVGMGADVADTVLQEQLSGSLQLEDVAGCRGGSPAWTFAPAAANSISHAAGQAATTAFGSCQSVAPVVLRDGGKPEQQQQQQHGRPPLLSHAITSSFTDMDWDGGSECD